MYARDKNLRKKVLVIFLFLFLFIIVPGYFLNSYLNKRAEVLIKMVSGTEYVSGENGQVIVRLNQRRGTPLGNNLCRATVLYPDKTYFLLDYPMVESTTPGNYYAEFIIPAIEGIYEEIITCIVVHDNKVETFKISSSFHVSKALNYVVNMSNTQNVRYNILMETMTTLAQELLAVKIQIEDNEQTFDEKISQVNSTVEGRFQDLYGNMAEAIQAMAEVYVRENEP